MVMEIIFKVLQEVNRQGVTILLVEQNVKESLDVSTWGYVLENGRIVLEGPGKDLLLNAHLKKAYLGM
jgi:branched-chain amino acid transport system ATP-binding protein